MKSNKIIDKLRKHNVKVTPQRVEIIKYLEEHKTHPGAEEIYQYVKKKYPAISLATVYNTLEKLVEIDEIIKLKISDDNKVNYEYNQHPHHHFYCKVCGKIFDIEIACEYAEKKEIAGHKIDEVHGYYKGICKKCLKK